MGILFDSTNPTAWDIGAHGRHIEAGGFSPACAYCVRSSAVVSTPADAIVELALRSFESTQGVDLSWVADRCSTEEERSWVQQWPGEHYRLLSGIARTVRPSLVVEVGTFTGMGTLSLLDGAENASVITYDVLAWDSFANSLLRREDFSDGRLEQRLGDLADDAYFADQRQTLLQADLVFVDGPKDGRFEPIFFPRLLTLLRESGHVVVADDIHFLNMIQLWMSLQVPKMDLTSFGHWSGTGLMMAL